MTGVPYQVQVPAQQQMSPVSNPHGGPHPHVQQHLKYQQVQRQTLDASHQGFDISQQDRQSFSQYCDQQQTNPNLSRQLRVAGIVLIGRGSHQETA